MSKPQLTPDELARLEAYLTRGTQQHQDFFRLPLLLTAEEEALLAQGKAQVVEDSTKIGIVLPVIRG